MPLVLAGRVERGPVTEAENFLRAHGLKPEAMDWRALPDLSSVKSYAAACSVRDAFIAKFGFAVLTAATVEALRAYAPYVEVGAGSGYWTHELQRAGIDAVATDPGTGRYGCVPDGWTRWTAVAKMGGVKAVRAHSDRTLLIVWPDYEKRWAATTLAAYGGAVVVYVGERGGCTADARFHALLDEGFALKEEIVIPQFPGIHDRVMVYERKRI